MAEAQTKTLGGLFSEARCSAKRRVPFTLLFSISFLFHADQGIGNMPPIGLLMVSAAK